MSVQLNAAKIQRVDLAGGQPELEAECWGPTGPTQLN